jgi:hypothetical protein
MKLLFIETIDIVVDAVLFDDKNTLAKVNHVVKLRGRQLAEPFEPPIHFTKPFDGRV